MIKKTVYLIILVVLRTFNVQSQEMDYPKLILELKDCFQQYSEPGIQSVIHDVKGKKINTFEQTDFEKSKFTQIDPLLNEVKISLVDQKNLSSWETANAKQISEYYFSGSSGFHIAAHGLEYPDGNSADKILIGGKELNPEEAAIIILESLKQYDIILKYEAKPFPIVLHTCKSAQGGEQSFAAKLSLILAEKMPQVVVVASPDLVWCEINDNGYNEYVADKSNKKKGNWLVFQNGKQTIKGSIDYKSTVSSILNSK